ncbi:MAG: PrsW family intramembrane metalloprotease, partial [Actinomycetota bacterium]
PAAMASALKALDIIEREPWSLIAGALLWGAIAATSLAGLANGGWAIVVARIGGPEFAAQWTAALTAPLVEESLKVAGVIFIYLIARNEMDDLLDGFVYGAVIGLGFAVVEDVFYFMAVFGGQPAEVLTGFFVRVIASGLYGHILYTALAGMGVAYFVSRRGRFPLWRRFAVAAGLFAVAAFAHFIWNSPWFDLFPRPPWEGAEWLVIPLAAAVKGVPFLVFVALLVWLAHRRERRCLRIVMATEIGGVAITQQEYETLEHPLKRWRVRREIGRRVGPRARKLMKRLQRGQIELAMVRTRVDSPEDPALATQRGYCRSLRDALLAIPGTGVADPDAWVG